MATIEQIRAARALLDWSQSDLADHAGLSQTGIARIENGTNKPNSQTLHKILTAFEIADIEFIGSTGVRKKTGEIKTYTGSVGFKFFLDDVYQTAIKNGTPDKPCEVFLSNVVHKNWVRWMGEDDWKKHTDRMTKDKNVMDVKIIVEEGDYNFPAKNYSEYKWFPKSFFNNQSFYSYHDRLVFLNFTDDNVIITIMHSREFAQGYRNLFRVAWDHLAKTPSDKR